MEVSNPHPRIPVYADMTALELHDPARQQSATVWRGSNKVSFKLQRCVESVRDLTSILESMASLDEPLSDKRLAKILATPLYSLAMGVRDMFNELEGNAREYSNLSTAQRNKLGERKSKFVKGVPLAKGSDLRDVRDKISAHIDKDTVVAPIEYWEKVNLPSYFRWLKLCLVEIMDLLELDVYGWTKDSGRPDVCSLMTVDGSVVDLYMQNGQPVAILGFTFTKSPKYGVADEIHKLVNVYNAIAGKCEELHSVTNVDDKAAPNR